MIKINLKERGEQGRHTSPIETKISRVDMTSSGQRKGALATPSTTIRGTQTAIEATGTITMGS